MRSLIDLCSGDEWESLVKSQRGERRVIRRIRQWLATDAGVFGMAYYWASLHREMRNRDPILVWSLGKTGTTSLASSISEATGRPALHCHRVSRASAKRTRSYPHEPLIARSVVGWRGSYVRFLLLDRSRHFDIVCGVRDPIARCISTVFQDATRFGWIKPGEPADLAMLQERVEELFKLGRSGTDWFEREILELTGIDVYERPFDPALGYEIIETERFRLLVLRFESLADTGPDALQRFFDLDRPVSIDQANVGSTKSYAEPYRQFLEMVRFSDRTTLAAYETAFARHFYTEEELGKMRRRWSS